MDYNEQTDAFYVELNALIQRFMSEFDLNTYTIMGVLEETKHDLIETGSILFEIDDELNPDGDDELLDL
jgi:hypothetical protein